MNNEKTIVDTALVISSAWTLTDEGINKSPQDTGKTLHARFAAAIRALNLPGISVEQSFINGNDDIRYGEIGSTRTDVIYRNSAGQVVWVWDFKTGVTQMTDERRQEIKDAISGSNQI